MMLYHALFAGLGLGLAGLATAAPTKTRTNDQASGPQNVVYYGGSQGHTTLSEYCKPNTGIDILVLSFLNYYGVSGDIPSGGFGNLQCLVNPDGSVSEGCSELASQIKGCQSAGKKVIVSLGGGLGDYSLTSQSQAKKIGQYLWDAYGKPGDPTVKRPFGDVVVDGWDFDIEKPEGGQWYQDLISALRSNFAKDPSNKYYITGAPQCPLPELNMGAAIQNSVFDYLFIQIYNNPSVCSLDVPGNHSMNWHDWTQFVGTTKSSSAKIFLGAPAGPGAAGSGIVGPSHLATVINGVKSDPYFGGVMLWDAHWSDVNVIADCTFAQQVKHILTTGKTCPGTPDVPDSVAYPSATSNPTPAYSAPASLSSPPAISSAAYPPPASTSPASSPPDNSSLHVTGSSGNGSGVAQWAQCGGTGYTGPTQCQAPFTCQFVNDNWSACH